MVFLAVFILFLLFVTNLLRKEKTLDMVKL